MGGLPISGGDANGFGDNLCILDSFGFPACPAASFNGRMDFLNKISLFVIVLISHYVPKSVFSAWILKHVFVSFKVL